LLDAASGQGALVRLHFPVAPASPEAGGTQHLGAERANQFNEG
jgi:hypothetical protein